MKIRAVLLCACLALLAGFAVAQPDARSVRIVVPAPPGGTLDASARILAQRLAAITGEPHVVENRPGANTLIGVDYVVRSAPDGRTLLFTGLSVIINPLLQATGYAPFEDLRPVAAVTAEHYALLASAGLELAGARDLERVAQARAGGLNCAAAPGPMGLACEQLRFRLRGAVTPIHYAGVGPALAAVAGGHVDIAFLPVEPAARLLEGKRAQLLAISAPTPVASGAAPPVLLADIWPDLVIESIQGIYVPAGTPEARVRQLGADVARVLLEPETQARLRAAGADPQRPSSPEAFTTQLRKLSASYGAVIRQLGLADAEKKR